MFAVVVIFTLKAEHAEAFKKLILNNAKTSLEKEDNCHQFDVCSSDDRPTEIFLYELYTDSAAFDIHLASEHFNTFAKQSESMVLTKEIRQYANVVQY